MQALQVFAGHYAREHIRNRGISAQDIQVVMGASGGPKWFVLSHLDRYLVQHWLPNNSRKIELVGSSIGAWRMAAYAGEAPLDAIELLEHEYLHQRYSAKPTAQEITQSVHDLLDSFAQTKDLTANPLRSLNIIAARAKHLGQLESKWAQTLTLTGVAMGNLVSRASLPYWFDRVLFQSADAQLPVQQWDGFKTTAVALQANNYRDALLASGAIPVVIEGVKNPAGAPKGMYRDGGMVDYHFDLPIKPKQGLVLFPHFMPALKPGWFDKPLNWRKVQAENYSHTIVVCPSRAFVESLPFGKIPDRKDFERMDNDSRIRYWLTVVDRNKAIAEAFDDWVHSTNPAAWVEPIETLAR